MKNIFLLLSLAICSAVFAQPEDFLYSNQIYSPNIRTVRFGPTGYQHFFPLVTLGGDSQLLLSFDDMDGGVKDYAYTVVHCDRDWKKSTLSPLEYINGFDEDDIQTYNFSFKTLEQYTHYEIGIPNRNMGFTKSGNYMLVVFDEADELVPVITRRFVVANIQAGVDAKLVRPVQVSKMHSHQEIDFNVDCQRLGVRNPMLEIRASVLQNQRWDNAITDLAPKFVRGELLLFDYQDGIVFPGGNESRFIDLRSLRSPQSDINFIGMSPEDGTIIAEMTPLNTRNNGAHLSTQDINGGFVIENFDQNDAELASEYVHVLFKLNVEQPLLQDHVYFYGAITDWQIRPEYRMTYNPAITSYVGRFPLKQGYYNYFFATVPSNSKQGQPAPISFENTEGDFSDTENDYLILIYYRPYGTRYDQVVGAYQFNTMRN